MIHPYSFFLKKKILKNFFSQNGLWLHDSYPEFYSEDDKTSFRTIAVYPASQSPFFNLINPETSNLKPETWKLLIFNRNRYQSIRWKILAQNEYPATEIAPREHNWLANREHHETLYIRISKRNFFSQNGLWLRDSYPEFNSEDDKTSFRTIAVYPAS